MRPAATRPRALPVPFTLYLALELGDTEWTLAMTARIDQAPLVRTMPARARETLETEIASAKTISACRGRHRSAAATRPAATGSGCIVIS